MHSEAQLDYYKLYHVVSAEIDYFRQIFDTTTDAIFIQDGVTGKILDVNQRVCEMFGYTYEEILTKNVQGLSQGDPPYTDHEAMTWMQTARTSGPQVFDWKAKRKDGDLFWVEVSAKFTFLGEEERYIVTARDIGERKRAEEALRESEALYRLLVEKQNDLVVKIDPKENLLFVSPSYCALFGKSEQELLGSSFMPLVHEDDWEITAKAMEDVLYSPHSAFLEHRALTPDGWKWLYWSGKAVLDRDGSVDFIIAVGRDISDKKRAEQELVDSMRELSDTKALLDAVVGQSPIPMVVASSPDRVIRIINSAFCELVKINEDVEYTKALPELQLSWKDYSPEGELISLNDLPLARTLRGESVRIRDYKIVRADGAERFVDVYGVPINNTRNELIAGFVAFPDVTERKKTEQLMIQTEKMLSLAGLAAGMAH